MTEFLVAVILCLWYIVFLQRWQLVSERRACRREMAKRPVGQIISAEITDAGLLMKGEIWAPEVKAKMVQDLTGFSIHGSENLIKGRLEEKDG
jgi:hypothetical protein